MEIDNTEIVENTQIDETAAADTLRPNPTRAEMMATFSSLMSQLGKEDMTNFLSGALAQVGTSSVTAPGKTGLGQMPAPKFGVKEDVAEMFEGEELSVLRTIDWTIFSPRVIAVEEWLNNNDNLINDKSE